MGRVVLVGAVVLLAMAGCGPGIGDTIQIRDNTTMWESLESLERDDAYPVDAPAGPNSDRHRNYTEASELVYKGSLLRVVDSGTLGTGHPWLEMIVEEDAADPQIKAQQGDLAGARLWARADRLD